MPILFRGEGVAECNSSFVLRQTYSHKFLYKLSPDKSSDTHLVS
jgi:hypothetical protein